MTRRRTARVLTALVMAALTACGSGDIGQPSVSVPPGTETLTFTAEGGVELEGLLYGDGDGEAEAAIVLAHQRGGRKESWNDFAVQASEEGYAVFAFDFRGYGRMTGERDTQLVPDLAAAVHAMRVRGFSEVYVVGASMGGTATLALAGEEEFAAVAALSPPRSFADASVQPQDVDEPVLLVYAVDDDPYNDDASAIQEGLSSVETAAYPGDDHGMALLESEPDLGDYILRFFAAGSSAP